ncbi:hypothetical protein RN001_003851 [Aquatica leii]|uniref:Lipase domain-containing protein n=1 Tax=Aquatica leii TaxID=1421715 RepID=A0AAN7ST38_9COLE|nr:hypothetical protein RN001_003851 [Aquatica leii]
MSLRRTLLSLCLIGHVMSTNITIGELPEEISKEFKKMSHIPMPDTTLKCLHRVKPELQFFLYNRSNTENPVTFDPKNSNIGEKKLVVLIHGWLTSYTTTEIQELKDAYLAHYDCNVLMVDWSIAAMQPYETSYCYIGIISLQVSKFLCQLSKTADLNLHEIHVIGHSMGAHVAGLTGHFITNKCKTKIGRITALDPPKELGSQKLKKDSARFVDVIHTDIDRLGSPTSYGHADYYVNCGFHQPGCKQISKILESDTLADVMCSNLRSVKLMTESIGSTNAVAVSCGLCPRYCRPNVISETYNLMGERAVHPRKHSVKLFLITTHHAHPYFIGWDGHNP